jgi:hypothetical protein
VGDVLCRVLVRAADKDLVKGMLEHFRLGGSYLCNMRMIPDTLLFSSCELSYVKNLKVILMLFEKVSDMMINCHQSEIIPMNLGPEQVHEVIHILSCHVGRLPFRYLGVPIHFEKLTRDYLQSLLDKVD